MALRYAQRLREVDRSQSIDGLELRDQAPSDQQVCSQLAHQPTLVRDGDRGLPNERNAPQLELEVE